MNEPVRILVVDDEADVESLITQRFRREIRKGEMIFVFAHDGQEALDLLADDPDILMVLSDINMPRMDGLTLLTRLGEERHDLKTVVVSAYGDMANIRTAMNRGAFDFLTKPIEFQDLEMTIRKTLTHLAEHRELQRQRLEAELSRAALARYFSPNVVAQLSSENGVLKGKGERRDATFLFTDLTGFTRLVESTAPDMIVQLVNEYIDGMARIVFAHEGTVMKIIGDAIQGIFGAPVPQPDHAARAVACALEMDCFAEEFRMSWQGRGVTLGATRIGLNTGDAIIGDFGGESFFDYTAYGDAVNTAARLEAANKVLGTRICVSGSVGERIENFYARPSGMLRLSGKAEPTAAFEPLSEARAAALETAAYTAAYELLAAGDPTARQAFAALVGSMPDDPLVLLHLQRALAGAVDVIIDATAH